MALPGFCIGKSAMQQGAQLRERHCRASAHTTSLKPQCRPSNIRVTLTLWNLEIVEKHVLLVIATCMRSAIHIRHFYVLTQMTLLCYDYVGSD